MEFPPGHCKELSQSQRHPAGGVMLSQGYVTPTGPQGGVIMPSSSHWLCFKGKEAAAQRGCSTCPKSHRSCSKPDQLNPKPPFHTALQGLDSSGRGLPGSVGRARKAPQGARLDLGNTAALKAKFEVGLLCTVFLEGEQLPGL